MGLGLKDGVPVLVEETVSAAVTEGLKDCDPVRLLVLSPVPVSVPEAVTVLVFEDVCVLVVVWDMDDVWDAEPVWVCVPVKELLPDPVCVCVGVWKAEGV